MARESSPLVICLVVEALEGGETSVEDELEVTQLTLGQADVGEVVGFSEERVVEGSVADVKVLEDSAVRCVGL